MGGGSGAGGVPMGGGSGAGGVPFHEGFSRAQIDPRDYEPVASVIRGYRAFMVDASNTEPPTEPFEGGMNSGSRGTLRGIFQTGYRWGPGVNTALCLPGVVTTRVGAFPSSASPVEHTQPIADCMCGFWAYTNGVHTMTVSGPVAFGVVEAGGRMVVGPDGFRAEKARIVALCFPEDPYSTKEPEPVPPDKPFLSGRSPGDLVISAAAAAGYAAAKLAHLLRGWDAPPPPKVLLKAYHSASSRTVPPDLQDIIRRLYPDAVVFTSVAAMQAAFPLSDLTAFITEDEQEEEEAS